jgi:hypothetical protein
MVKFQSNETRSYNSVIIGKPQLLADKNRQQVVKQEAPKDDKDIGMVACYLKARTFRPHLALDKLLTLHGAEQVEFVRWALCKNDDQQKIVILTNKESSNIICNVALEGPFKLVTTETNSSLKHPLAYKMKMPQQSFNLSDNSNLVLEVEFKPGKASDHKAWPLARKIYKHGTIIISYANGDVQKIKLEGLCLRPVLRLNTIGFEGHTSNALPLISRPRHRRVRLRPH